MNALCGRVGAGVVGSGCHRRVLVGVLAATVGLLFHGSAVAGEAPVVATEAALHGAFGTGERAVLTDAPHVPPPIERTTPAKVVVELEVTEVTKRLSDGVEYNFWTFGGSVPGKFIRVREGDTIEFHLHNHPTSRFPHNIDLHAVTGPGGGAASSFTAPGQTTIFSFKAINPGLYVYHCAAPPVAMHVANGMYGLILVEPEIGLRPADREFYIMQSEFYTSGKFGEAGLQSFDQDKAVDERPPYVVFNGEVGSMAGERALKARVGEMVRLYVGNGGPNLISSFHLIGEVFDRVYQEGGTYIAQQNVGTTLIPAGGTAVVEFTFDVPGTYIIVDHSLFRAFNKGAVAMIEVEGPANALVYSGKQHEQPYKPANTTPLGAAPVGAPLQMAPPLAGDLKSRMDRGLGVYNQICFACHQADGKGLPNVFPPLAQSDYLLADKLRAVRGIIEGQQGEMVVNGQKYHGIMPPVALSDQQISDVMTFALNSWGNAGGEVSLEEVKLVREKIAAAAAPASAAGQGAP